MISKSEIKHVRSLHRKKGRKSEGQFIVEGVKGVEAVVKAGWRVRKVYVLSTLEVSIEGAKEAIPVSEKDMAAMTALHSPSPVLAVVDIPELTPSAAEGRILALDGISDPGNLGTLIRTADWFGIRRIWVSPDTVDAFNPKVVQATMGSLFRVQMEEKDLVTALESSEGPVYGAVMDGEGIGSLTSDRGVLVIGSESHGIRPEVQAKLDHKITIPGAEGAESLNASIAAGILMHAWTQS